MRRAGGSRWLVGVLFGLLALGASGVAPLLAQDVPAASRQVDASKQVLTPTQDAEVQRLYGAGIEAAKSGNFEKARELFEKAFRMKQHWKIAANLGRAESALGKFPGAADHLEYFLRQAGPNDISQEDRDKAQALLNEALLKSARIDIITDAQDVDVLVDGKVVGRTPFYDGRVYVLPGQHEVTVRKKGYRSSPDREQVNVSGGGRSSRRLEFELKEDATGGGKGSAEPGGAGGSGDGGQGGNGGGGGSPNSTDTEPEWRTPLIIGFAVLGAVGAAAGAGFTVASNDKSEEAEGIKTMLTVTTPQGSTLREFEKDAGKASQFSDLQMARIDQDSFRNAAIAGFVVGGIGVIGAVTVAVIPLRKSSAKTKPSGLRILPLIGTSGGSFLVRGSF